MTATHAAAPCSPDLSAAAALRPERALRGLAGAQHHADAWADAPAAASTSAPG